jgi:glycosyltransferase involved in cell wall biosynthesis
VTAAETRDRRPSARVAILFHGLSGGGMESSMLRLAHGFASRGYEVEIVIGRREGEFADRIPEGIASVEFGHKQRHEKKRWLMPAYLLRASLRSWPFVFSRNVRPFGRLTELPRIVSYLQAQRPDALLAAEPRCNLLAALARRIAGVNTRIVISERVQPSVHAADQGPWSHRHLRPLLRSAYLSADAIVAVSDGVADDLAAVAGIPRDRIVTVYNPVVGADILAEAEQPLDHPWFANDAPPVVLAAGRIAPQKDYHTLIKAFARVRREREARLVILGAQGLGCADYVAAIKALIGEFGLADAVAFPGFVANPFAYMARASVFVLSSRYEGLPGVLIQALACGCPVVSTDCPSGPREVLADGQYGPLVPVGDDAALAAAILAALDNPLPKDVLRGRGAMFSVDAAVDGYLRLLLGETTTGVARQARTSALPRAMKTPGVG